MTRTLLLIVLISVLGGMSVGVVSSAQGTSDDELTVYAEFGYAGMLSPERFCPMRVWVDSGDEAITGTIVIEYAQDSTQTARVMMPFSTTPNKVTPFEINVCLPQSSDSLKVLLLSERGRVLQALEYTSFANSSQLQLPIRRSSSGLILSVGRTTLRQANEVWSRRFYSDFNTWGNASNATVLDQKAQRAFSNVIFEASLASQLPITWAGYDGVMTLVIRDTQARKMDPRALDAMKRWVRSGGVLVVELSAAGKQWRTLIPEIQEGDLIKVAPESAVLQASAEVTDVMDQAYAYVVQIQNEEIAKLQGEESLEDEEVDPVDDPPEIEKASATRQRLMRLTAAGIERGWSLSMLQSDDQGALAQGPVGMGWVIVLGFEPAELAKNVTSSATAAGWELVLSEVVEDSFVEQSNLSWLDWEYPGSGGSTLNRIAVARGLDHLANSLTLGNGMFLMIAGAVFVLGMLVGPVDFFALKKLKALRWSWFSAICWALLASALAYLAPGLIRTDPSHEDTISMVDVDSESYAYRVKLTGLFASKSERAQPTDVALDSWWRGMASPRIDDDGALFKSSLPLIQKRSAQSERGLTPGSFPMNLWTFRTFMSLRNSKTDTKTSIRRTDTGWAVRIDGLPESKRISGVLRIGPDTWFDLTLKETPASDRTFGAMVKDEQARYKKAFTQWQRLNLDEMMQYSSNFVGGVSVRPALMFDLPGADRRSHVIERSLATGRWGVVYVFAQDIQGQAKLLQGAMGQHDLVARYLLRLKEPVLNMEPDE